jgi:SAM-dependent methyltransferase
LVCFREAGKYVMSNFKSKDYHDYVIREGKLIAEFEEMYRNSETIPWHQNEQEKWIDIRLTKEMMSDEVNLERSIDYGCGTGHYLDILVRNLGGKGIGFDISPTAITLAEKNFSNYFFCVGDLMVQNFKFDLHTVEGKSLHTIRGTLWYVFPKMSIVIENLIRHMSVNDILLVVQNFPPLNSNFVGKDVIPNPEALTDFLLSNKSLILEKKIWYEQNINNNNDSWFIGKFLKIANE